MPEYRKKIFKNVAYFRRTTNYPLVPSSMLHSGKTRAATVTTFILW
jgi:hypothetical protein